MKHLFGAIATFLVLLQPSDARAAEPLPCFKIYDASGFKGKPNLAPYGIEPANVIYAANHFWPGKKGMENLPQRSAVVGTIKQWITSRQPMPTLTAIDVEHWPNVGDDAAVAASVDKYLALFKWTKQEVGPGSLVSYYGVPPLRDYWRAMKPGSKPYQEWQAENDKFARLAQAVEAFTPSLYTFYNDAKGWEQYATANVAEARRLGGSKPVYPFVWPHYHDSSKEKGYIGKELWLAQLQTLERVADGVVIWAGLEQWDENAGWWDATKEFIGKSSRVCSRALPNSPELHSVRPK